MIQVQVAKDFFYGNGVARDYTLSFPAPGAPVGQHYIYLIVSDDDGSNAVPVLSDFWVSRHGDAFCVTYPMNGAPLPPGKKLTVYRKLPLTQPTDLQNGGNFHPETIEDTFDWLVMQIQQLAEEGERSLKVPISAGQNSENAAQHTEKLIADIYAARDATVEAAGRTEEADKRAAHSVESALAARDAAVSQAEATNALMAAEMGKINAIAGAFRQDMQTARDDVLGAIDKAGAVKTVNGIAASAGDGKNVQVLREVTQAQYDALKEGAAGGLVPGATYIITDAEGFDVSERAEPDTIPLRDKKNTLVSGAVRTEGTPAATGFLLADGTDLATVFAQQSAAILGVAPTVQGPTTGSGNVTTTNFKDAYLEKVGNSVRFVWRSVKSNCNCDCTVQHCDCCGGGN